MTSSLSHQGQRWDCCRSPRGREDFPQAMVARSRRLAHAALICALLLTGLSAYAAPEVTIIAPKAKSLVRGVVKVVAAPSMEATKAGFSYATMFVDDSGRSISNSLPLRFELDTTRFANGPYEIRVEVFDNAGGYRGAATVPVYIMNPLPLKRDTPAPAAPVTPPAVKDAVVGTQAAVAGARMQPVVAPTLLFDGHMLATEPPVSIEQGRAIVTLRPLVDATGGAISWDAAQQQVTVRMNGHTVVMVINQSTALVDGTPVDLGLPVRVAQGRTLVPATAWRDVFGGAVAYDSEIRCVLLHSNIVLNASIAR